MSKFLNKSLIVAMSSLCAFSTSIDAVSFKADRELDYEEANENSNDVKNILHKKILDYNKGEKTFVNRENPGSFRNYKDIAQNIIEGVAELGLGGLMGGFVANSAFSDKAVPAGVALGAIAAGFLFIPTKVRAIKNILRNEGFLKALYRLSAILRSTVVASGLKTEKEASSTGNFGMTSS